MLLLMREPFHMSEILATIELLSPRVIKVFTHSGQWDSVFLCSSRWQLDLEVSFN